MSNDKVQMPSSGAGLTRYFSEYHSKIEMKPQHVVVMIILIILVEILLNWQGYAWFGIQ
jgi:preprotein translocase subunit Sec61beta